LTESESVVLPLDDLPKASDFLAKLQPGVKAKNRIFKKSSNFLTRRRFCVHPETLNENQS